MEERNTRKAFRIEWSTFIIGRKDSRYIIYCSQTKKRKVRVTRELTVSANLIFTLYDYLYYDTKEGCSCT